MKDAPNKSLDASGGGVFLNLLGAAKGALIRAAASTPPLDSLLSGSPLTNFLTKIPQLMIMLVLASLIHRFSFSTILAPTAKYR
jgi:hypothetical protein